MSASNDHPAVWSRLDVVEGLGLGTLIAETDGFRLEATEVVVDRGARYSCRFTVWADLAWATRGARVEILSPDGVRTLELASKGAHWTRDGKPAPDLDGCVDVDVASTPLTNTLPIRRLGLSPGESREIPVAWIDIPDLRVHRTTQRYTRHQSSEGRGRYVYGDPGNISYELTVDRHGLIVDYEGFAARVS
ncbi:putative glycolipid-binding domain-containing protein [Nocardiopsis rhodophaea]|uniref:putative glycolipid-binding domain-containing protein n=1 Tax=Nocardiopsis rhodophaea TaxID=280238 RepID=UPI0031CF7228